MALVKYNNNSISAITAASSLPTGAMTLIKEQTASSSGTISFVDGTSDVVLDSTYPIYLFEFINIHSSGNDVSFQFQTSTDSGSSYGVTVTSTSFLSRNNEADSATFLGYQTGDDEAQTTNFIKLAGGHGNGNDESLSGYLYIFNPSSTTFVKHFMGNINSYHEADISISWHMAGYFNTTSAVDAVQFKFHSGNIDAGTFKLYGIKDS
jgi:hypothetical protein